eukprot:scaffold136616_cov15-Tisochrysis_lutea.AAC.1
MHSCAESNGPSPRASLAADGGVENAGCRRVVGGGASVEHLNPNPLPPSTADALEKARVSGVVACLPACLLVFLLACLPVCFLACLYAY